MANRRWPPPCPNPKDCLEWPVPVALARKGHRWLATWPRSEQHFWLPPSLQTCYTVQVTHTFTTQVTNTCLSSWRRSVIIVVTKEVDRKIERTQTTKQKWNYADGALCWRGTTFRKNSNLLYRASSTPLADCNNPLMLAKVCGCVRGSQLWIPTLNALESRHPRWGSVLTLLFRGRSMSDWSVLRMVVSSNPELE